jgi:colanic acid/amylovoran biosynthesis protein
MPCLPMPKPHDNILNACREMAVRAAIPSAIFQYLLMEPRRNKKERPKRHPSGNIIIVGGQLFNKGSQAMTFTAVDQLAKRFPQSRIYLFSGFDFSRPARERDAYAFTILPWTPMIRLSVFSNLFMPFAGRHRKMANRLRGIVRKARFFVDISGYALSSQWGVVHSFYFLLNIMVAEKFLIPYYVFPQSMGPLEYHGLEGLLLSARLLRRCLQYPEKIFVREQEGLEALKTFREENVSRATDIVLSYGTYAFSNIYRSSAPPRRISIESHGVGIIPNQKVFERTDPHTLYRIYRHMIEALLRAKRGVYLLRHAHEDLHLCEAIKRFFARDPRVRLMAEDLTAKELESVIGQFDFVIASRYHAIIHAYKQGVPALVLGWATKYSQLLTDFQQKEYFFDVRKGLSAEDILRKMEQLMAQCRREQGTIVRNRQRLAADDVFAVLH